MDNIYQTINQVVKKYVDGLTLTDLVIGTIEDVNPIKLRIPEMRGEALTGNSVLLSSNVIEKTIDVIKHKHTYYDSDSYGSSQNRETEINLQNIQFYDNDKPLGYNKDGTKLIVNEGLKKGDTVLVLICGKGSRFVILSKLYVGN